MTKCEKLGCNNKATYLVHGDKSIDYPDKKKCTKCMAKSQQIGKKKKVEKLPEIN